MLQKNLVNIEQYNAAIELPFSGLAGLGAYTAKANRRDLSLAVEELDTCIKLCRHVESALSGQPQAARKNFYRFSAWQRIVADPKDRAEFRDRITALRRSLEKVLRLVRGEPVEARPTPAEFQKLESELREIYQRIKQAIPRDAAIASLMGSTRPHLARQS
jgi:hypothetical protein